jgi:CRP-like cAMP-binding protein
MNISLHEMIKGHPFVLGMHPAHQQVLVDCARIATFEPGTILFNEGEPANEFFLMHRGRVALEIHEPPDGVALVATIGADGVFGWSWLYPPFVWHFRARVIEATTAVVLNGARLLVRSERDHDFGYELMKRVSRILIDRLQSATHEMLLRTPLALAFGPA